MCVVFQCKWRYILWTLSCVSTLLDKVTCAVTGDFQIDQCHLALKVALKRSIGDHIWSQKEQNISIGPTVLNKVITYFISLHFIMFLFVHQFPAIPTKASNDLSKTNCRNKEASAEHLCVCI